MSKSQFFIVSDYDAPNSHTIAERRADGKFYYIHPTLANEKEYHGMTPSNPTPLEDFGIRWLIEDGQFKGALLDVSRAKYSDGKARKWQGMKKFSFSLASEMEVSR